MQHKHLPQMCVFVVLVDVGGLHVIVTAVC